MSNRGKDRPHGKVPEHGGAQHDPVHVTSRHEAHPSTIGDHNRTKIREKQQGKGREKLQSRSGPFTAPRSHRDPWDVSTGKR